MRNVDYVKLYVRLDTLIDSRMIQIEELHTIATKTTQVNDDMPHAHNASDKISSICVKIITLEDEVKQCALLQAEIESAILSLPEPVNEVMKLLYIDDKTISEVARMKDYSNDWVYKQMYRGLALLKIPTNSIYYSLKI